MSFHVDDEELLEKYKAILTKIEVHDQSMMTDI